MILDAPDSMNEAANKLGIELEKLYKTSEFVRVREIVAELERMEKLSLRYASEYFNGGALDWGMRILILRYHQQCNGLTDKYKPFLK